MNTKSIVSLITLLVIGIAAYAYIALSFGNTTEPYSGPEVSPNAKPSDYSDHTYPVPSSPPDEVSDELRNTGTNEGVNIYP
jgi:hypothetical protein